jgi:hypothetical protein
MPRRRVFAERDAVAEDDRPRVHGGYARPRGDDAGQVQRIDGGDTDQLAGVLGATDLLWVKAAGVPDGGDKV